MASLLFLVSALVHPFWAPALNLSPAANAALAAQAFANPGYALSDTLYILAFPLLIFGNLALYSYLSRRVDTPAFLGMLASVGGAAIFLGCVGTGAFAFPAVGDVYQHGGTDAMVVAAAILTGPAVTMGALGAFLLLLGALVTTMAIWREGSLPKWAGVLFTLGFVFFLGSPVLPPPVRILAGTLIAIGGCWLAYGLWQKAPEMVMPASVLSLPRVNIVHEEGA
jgi:hypothetical protein